MRILEIIHKPLLILHCLSISPGVQAESGTVHFLFRVGVHVGPLHLLDPTEELLIVEDTVVVLESDPGVADTLIPQDRHPVYRAGYPERPAGIHHKV